jgi:hypothetical protein
LEHIHCVTGLLRTREDDQLVLTSTGDYDLYAAAIYMLKKVRKLN